MATGEAVGLDDMSWKQLNKLMEALKISGDGVETLTQVRNRIRQVITDAKNTTTWSPGEVRYFLVKFQNKRILRACIPALKAVFE